MDACGNYICFRLLEELPSVKIVFFSREESGGIGSSNIDTQFFNDSRFIGSIDRKGIQDFASQHGGTYRVSDNFLKDIKPLLTKYKRSEVVGGFTDAFNLNVKVSCFNMSCGYYDPHSDKETVIISEVEDTLQFCIDIAKNLTNYYYFEKPKPVYQKFNCQNFYTKKGNVYIPKHTRQFLDDYYDNWDDWNEYYNYNSYPSLSTVNKDNETRTSSGILCDNYLAYQNIKKYLEDWEKLEVLELLLEKRKIFQTVYDLEVELIWKNSLKNK